MGKYDRPEGVDPLVWLLEGQARDPHFRSRVQEGDILAALDAAAETIQSQRETIEGYQSILRATIRDYHEQGDAIRLLQEMKVVELDAVEMGSLRDSLSTSGSALIAYDPLDRAIKIKHDGRWSPPLGHEVDQG